MDAEAARVTSSGLDAVKCEGVSMTPFHIGENSFATWNIYLPKGNMEYIGVGNCAYQREAFTITLCFVDLHASVVCSATCIII